LASLVKVVVLSVPLPIFSESVAVRFFASFVVTDNLSAVIVPPSIEVVVPPLVKVPLEAETVPVVARFPPVNVAVPSVKVVP